MVDFQTQNKLYGYMYNTPIQTTPTASYNDLYRQTGHQYFTHPRVPVHDCRPEGLQDARDPGLWQAQLLKHGLDQTYDDVNNLHAKQDEGQRPEKRTPQKMLYRIGETGTKAGQFNFPRGVATDPQTGEIYVADSMNHRVQVFNQCGVYKTTFGQKGKSDGEFREPCGVAVLSSGDITVADTKNNRVQILTKDHEDNLVYKSQFPTKDPPYAVVSDYTETIIVSTTKKTIERHDGNGVLCHSFDLGPPKEKFNAVPIALHENGQIVVSNRAKKEIQYYSPEGRLLSKFIPVNKGDGLACEPAGVCLTPRGEVLVLESLNHVVNQYSATGQLQDQLLCPTDDAGAMQECTLGPEGHFVATETNSNGGHCLKIFRFYECECHRTKPPSRE